MPPILNLTRLQTGYVAGNPELNASSPIHTCSVHLIVTFYSPWTKSSTQMTLILKKEEKLSYRDRVAMCRFGFLISLIILMERTLFKVQPT
jgi:hypothetical protein